ncbi:MAG TPA: ABC transporter ATP-binding protein [Alphaproteobacteria bacterium]|nr:ABC transporter ATP-binding protein [Alphaproteobacteria bacterium]
MFALEGIGLRRRFGGFVALDGVDIAVPEGEIRALIGPNGAGKSTLIDVLSGRAREWSGEVRLFGAPIDRRSVQERRSFGLARSFQRTNIFADLTVLEQLQLAARTSENNNAEEVAEALSLSQHAGRRAGDISYGDQRRLDLALALIGRPRVLLLDEPAAGLSLGESLALARLLKDLVGRWGVTVLLVEHDMEVVFSICDRITVLHLGRTLAEGTPDEVRQIPEVVTAYLGTGVS